MNRLIFLYIFILFLFHLKGKKVHTTAEPTATPPAVAAICANNPGCFGAAAAGGGTAAGGGGAALGGGGGGAARLERWVILNHETYQPESLIFWKSFVTAKISSSR